MLSGYTVGKHVFLFNIEEMTCTGDPHKVAWLEPMNENGGRRLLPFSGMTIGEAYMWARYRGHKAFIDKLEQYTYDTLASDEGRCGRVGDHCVIKNAKAIRNVAVRSTEQDPT
jgi:hypothetical protein